VCVPCTGTYVVSIIAKSAVCLHEHNVQ